jgi:hypothetical protein
MPLVPHYRLIQGNLSKLARLGLPRTRKYVKKRAALSYVVPLQRYLAQCPWRMKTP